MNTNDITKNKTIPLIIRLGAFEYSENLFNDELLGYTYFFYMTQEK